MTFKTWRDLAGYEAMKSQGVSDCIGDLQSKFDPYRSSNGFFFGCFKKLDFSFSDLTKLAIPHFFFYVTLHLQAHGILPIDPEDPSEQPQDQAFASVLLSRKS